MVYKIEFSPAEEAVLKLQYEQHKEQLLSAWDIKDFTGFIKLLALHGSDSFSSLSLSD